MPQILILILIAFISLSGCAQEFTSGSVTDSFHDTGWLEPPPQSSAEKWAEPLISEDPKSREQVFDEEDALDRNVSEDLLDEIAEFTD